MAEVRYRLADLLRLMERLRDPEHGCPWDLRQDFRSIVPSTLEECYELAEAIEGAKRGEAERLRRVAIAEAVEKEGSADASAILARGDGRGR